MALEDTTLNKFPTIDQRFDLVAIDCIKISDEFYVPIIRYMVRDHVNKKVTAGVTLQTSATCDQLLEVAEFIKHTSRLGLFVVDVCAFGTIYTESMEEIEDVNWNHINSISADETISNDQQTKVNYLH